MVGFAGTNAAGNDGLDRFRFFVLLIVVTLDGGPLHFVAVVAFIGAASGVSMHLEPRAFVLLVAVGSAPVME
jgi:hypothetical protein